MRIAVVAPPWLPVPPPAYGGIEAVVDRLARGFAAAGHDVVLCAAAESTCPVRSPARFPCALPDETGLALPELCHVLDAYDAVRDADVVHDHTLAGPFVAGPAHPPLVVTHHGPFDRRYRRLFHAIAHLADVVAISRAQAREAVPGTVSRVIHHGIGADEIPVGDGRGGYLAFLGRMSPTKGVHNAVEVARRAGLPLRIAGKCREPREREYFDERIRPALGHGIEYLGELSRSATNRLLGEALALVNPIEWNEPFGLVMIEALAAGTPVLALANGAAPEIVDHGVTGFLAACPAELAAEVEAIGDLDRRACRRSVEERFSTERMIRGYLRLFAEVLARAGGPRRPPTDALVAVVDRPHQPEGRSGSGNGAEGVIRIP